MNRLSHAVFPAFTCLLAACGSSGAPASSAASVSAAAPTAKPAEPNSAKPAVASQAPAGAAAAPGSAAKEKVRAGYLSVTTPASLPWVTKGAGLFDKYGLDVSLQYLAPALLSQTLLAGKDLDVGYASAPNVATVDAQGGDLVILATSTQGGVFTILAGPGVKSVADLRGKAAAITSNGSTTDFLMRQLLQTNNLAPNQDVTLTSMPDAATMVAALKSGQVAAAVTTEPFTSIAQSQGATVLFDQAASGVKAATAPVVAKRGYVAGHRDALKRLLMANMDAIKLMKTRPAEATQHVMPYLKIDDVAALQRGLEATNRGTENDMIVPLDDLASTIKIASGTVPEVAKLKPEDMVDLSLLQEIKASGFIDQLWKQ